MRLLVPVIICLSIAAGALAAGTPAICTLASKGDVAKVSAMLKKSPKLVFAKDKDGATPLHYAAAGGQKAVAEALIAKKANVNARKKDGVTPMIVAAAMGKFEVVQVLLDRGADAYAADKKERTALSVAQDGGHEEVVKLLQEYMATRPSAAAPATDESTSSTESKDLTAAKPAAASTVPAGDVMSLAQRIGDLLAKNDFNTITKYFDANMRAAMPPQKLQQAWLALNAQAGRFKRQLGTSTSRVTQTGQTYDVLTVACEFEKTTIDIQVAFNQQKQIAGVHFVPHK